MISNGLKLDTLKSNFNEIAKKLGFAIDTEYLDYVKPDKNRPASTTKKILYKETAILLGNVKGYYFPLKWVFNPEIVPESITFDKISRAYNNGRFERLVGTPITFDEPVEDIVMKTKRSPYTDKAKTILRDTPEVNFMNMMTPSLLCSEYSFNRETRLLFVGKNMTTGQRYGVFYNNLITDDFAPKNDIPIYMCWVAELKSLNSMKLLDNWDWLFRNAYSFSASISDRDYLVSREIIKHLYRSVYGTDEIGNGF